MMASGLDEAKIERKGGYLVVVDDWDNVVGLSVKTVDHGKMLASLTSLVVADDWENVVGGSVKNVGEGNMLASLAAFVVVDDWDDTVQVSIKNANNETVFATGDFWDFSGWSVEDDVESDESDNDDQADEEDSSSDDPTVESIAHVVMRLNQAEEYRRKTARMHPLLGMYRSTRTESRMQEEWAKAVDKKEREDRGFPPEEPKQDEAKEGAVHQNLSELDLWAHWPLDQRLDGFNPYYELMFLVGDPWEAEELVDGEESPVWEEYPDPYNK